jgi:Ergosterol biosynthesis ERG4/ERG24 family
MECLADTMRRGTRVCPLATCARVITLGLDHRAPRPGHQARYEQPRGGKARVRRAVRGGRHDDGSARADRLSLVVRASTRRLVRPAYVRVVRVFAAALVPRPLGGTCLDRNFAGYYVFRSSNLQKHTFRTIPGTKVWSRDPQFIQTAAASAPSSRGQSAPPTSARAAPAPAPRAVPWTCAPPDARRGTFLQQSAALGGLTRVRRHRTLLTSSDT